MTSLTPLDQFRLFRLPTKQLNFEMPLEVANSEADGGTENVQGTNVPAEKKSEEVLNHILEKIRWLEPFYGET